MDLSGITPPCMNWSDSNLPEQWKKFRRHVELIFAGPLKENSEPEQVAYLLIWAGEKGRDIHASWTNISEEDSKKLETYFTRFQSHVQPKLNPIFARYKFFNEVQNDDTIDTFVTRLRLLAGDCNFPNIDEMIRDRIVFGTNSGKIRERLINVGEELTIDKAIQIAQSFEYSQKQLKSMAERDVHDVTSGAKGFSHRAPNRHHRTNNFRSQNRSQLLASERNACFNCGSNNHDAKSVRCPAKGVTCYACGKNNHFAKMCRSRKPVNDVSSDTIVTQCDTSGSETEYYIDTVNMFSSPPDRAFVPISVGPAQTQVDFKIDTGSAVNVLPFTQFQRLNLKHPLEPPESRLTSYTGNMLPVKGTVKLTLRYKGKIHEEMCYVVDSTAPPLLSLRSSVDLGIIKLTYAVENTKQPLDKQSVMESYGKLFQGIGVIKGESTLHLKSDAVPVVNPPRRVPEALRQCLHDELNRMERDGIIEKIAEPTDWVNSLVVVEKPKTGKLRICLDPKALNEAIRRPHYPMPTLDDVTLRLADAKYFSILDITHAYWSIRLDKKSSYLTTMSTIFGRYRWLRLPFGISASGDIFQRKVDEIFEGLTGVTAIVDDILIYGKTRQEHDDHLRTVLERAQQEGIRFNPDKCIIGVSEVPFFGHLITSTGLKPDPSKIEAISKLGIPQNRQELETLLGMVNYLQKFSPNLAEITSPMRSLLKKDIEFVWDQTQTDSFNKMKQVITQSPVLAFFDHKKPVTLECDASKHGVGSAIMQDGQPVAYASKTLTQTESNYANIEREMLAILYACKRFHQYIYGRHVTVHSDHKPLSAIMKKPLSAAPPRLQRMMLQLQKYDLNVIHVSGKEVPISDLLSRQPLNETFTMEGLDLHIHTVLKCLHITDRRLESLKVTTQSDIQMQTLKQTIIDGWPDSRTDCNESILEFWNHRDELSYGDSLIFRGQTIVVPNSVRQEMIESVHHSHMGVQKSIQRAKDALFWPGMTKQITDYVNNCDICQKYRQSNQKEPLSQHIVPERPWQFVSADIFTWDNREHLVTVDAYSNYFEIDLLPDMKCSTVIKKLKSHFSRHGIPDKLKTDNAGQFSSDLMTNFANEWNFMQEFSSPTYAQSNGLAENSVKTAKRLLQKEKESGRDPFISILEYRNTPLQCGYTPSQLLMGRRTKSILPVTSKHLKPQTVNPNKVVIAKQVEKEKQKQYFIRSSKPLSPLNMNAYVRLQVGKIWKPAKVIKVFNDRSYEVQTKEGGIYRRNRRFLNKTRESFPEITDFAPNVICENIPKQLNDPQEAPSQHQSICAASPIQRSPRGVDVNLPYQTRSGRVVKPSKYYSSDQRICK